MGHSEMPGNTDSTVFDYLHADAFIKDMVTARALTTAFELNLIDLLANRERASFDELAQIIPTAPGGLELLLQLLSAGAVIEPCDGSFKLTEQFAAVLPFRDILLAKLDFSHIAAHDFIDSFTHLTVAPTAFMKRSGMFRLFDYGAALESTQENRRHTERWMKITTALTRYEAPVCFSVHDLSGYSHMLDIGGNSGEFALQACKRYKTLKATVLDLPVVCEIGARHVNDEPECSRISFAAGNARTDDLPGGCDLITFKSMLHDWPEAEAIRFLSRAADALEPGGTMLVFERGPFDTGTSGLPYSQIPLLLFAHTLRQPDIYRRYLEEIGFSSVTVQWVTLDQPFFLVSGIKP